MNTYNISSFGLTFFKALLSNLFTFIDHKSRMTLTDSSELHLLMTFYENKM